MRKAIIGAIAAIAIAGAGYVAFNAWLAWGLPARPLVSVPQIKACENSGLNSTRQILAEMHCKARVNENAILRRYPQLATRDGDDLSFNYRGKPIQHLVKVPDGKMAYDSVEIRKALLLFDPETGQKEPVALISEMRGEFEYRSIVHIDGSLEDVADASASPDGKMIATGTNGMMAGGNAYTSEGFALTSWPGDTLIAQFEPSCRVITWRDNTHLTVTCIHAYPAWLPGDQEVIDYLAFDANVWRDSEGKWQMQATRWLGAPPRFTELNDIDYSPAFSLRPLPRFISLDDKQLAARFARAR